MENLFDFSGFFTPGRIALTARIVIGSIIAIVGIQFLSRGLRRYTQHRLSLQHAMVFQKIVIYTGYSLLVIFILRELGFKISTLLGAAGIFGIAIGFASQTSLSNIISGLFLIAEKPFEINDIITVGTTTGVVLSIDTMSVKLRTFDNKFIRIPNETLIKAEVTTVTRFPIRRVDIDVGVAYKENISQVREALLEVARDNPLCLNEPEPMILMSGFGNSSLDFRFLVWAAKEDWLKLKNSIMEEIKVKFDEKNIEIPFPHISFYTGSVTDPLPIKLVSPDKTD